MKSKGFISKYGVNQDSENGLSVQPSGQGRKLPSKNRTTPLEDIFIHFIGLQCSDININFKRGASCLVGDKSKLVVD